MPTELGHRYSRDVAVVIGWLLRGKLHYHIDQLVIYYLWDLYRRHQPGFRDAPLGQDMADWECGQESYIWSAKGERKYLDEPFLKARQE